MGPRAWPEAIDEAFEVSMAVACAPSFLRSERIEASTTFAAHEGSAPDGLHELISVDDLRRVIR
jgi:hypothetical protein